MSTVSLMRADSYEIQQLRQAIETLLEPLGGMKNFVKPGDRVLLKPNFVSSGRPTKECVTRKEVFYCVAKLVQEAGGKPFLGDSPAFGSAHGVAKNNGYLPLLEELGIPIIEFHGKRYDTDSENFRNLRLSKEAMEADVVINLPKVKSHVQLTLTMGVKNLFGCVPGKMKAWWHLEAGKDPAKFAEMIIETARAIAPDLTIIDGIIGHEGNGPTGGEPRQLNVLGASSNVFAIDQAIAAILQVEPARIPILDTAIKMGYAPSLEEIDFPLFTPDAFKIKDWKLPSNMIPIDFALPRIMKSTVKNLYIRFIKEPIAAYSSK